MQKDGNPDMANSPDIVIALDPSAAPNTVNNFIHLISKGYYDGLCFHRVIPGFMVQGGCPDGTGMGGPGYSIRGEFESNGAENPLKHDRGVVSMARTGFPDSAGSQFFIMVDKAPHLDGQYAAFGKVIEGMKNREIPLVSLDMPQLPKLPPAMDVVTASTAYIRLHGRNKEEWWGKDDHSRYDYLYSDSEIEAWAARIKRICEQARRVLVYFNNHPFGKAVRNAQTLAKRLGILNQG